jgi:tetratricopeptide (TPR) repeat protein
MVHRSILVLLWFVLCLPGSLLRGQTPSEEARFHHAQAFEAAGDLSRAAELYEQLWRGDSSNVVYFLGLQRTLLQAKEYDRAIEVTERQRRRVPGDLNLRASLGGVYYKAGRDAEASAVWNALIAEAPTDPMRYRLVAGALAENRLLDRAAETYRQARVATGDPALFTMELAQLLAVTMDYRGATREYLRWLRANPSQLAFVQGRMSAYSGNPEARAAAVEVLRGEIEQHEEAVLYEVLGWLYLEGKEYDRALAVVRKLDRLTASGGGALYAFGLKAFRAGAFATAAEAYREAIASPLGEALMPAAKFAYARALTALSLSGDSLRAPLEACIPVAYGDPSRTEDAIRWYQRVIEEYPGSEYAARSYYQIGMLRRDRFFDLHGAADAFARGIELGAGQPALAIEGRLQLGMIALAQGDTARAAERFRVVAGAVGASPDQQDEAAFRLAEIAYFSGNLDGAVKLLQELSLTLTADIANDALALSSLLEMNREHAGALLAQMARGDLLARQHRFSEAAAVMEEVVRGAAGQPLFDDALLKLASAQEAMGQYGQALETYRRMLSDSTQSVALGDRALFRSAEVQEFGLSDGEAAIASYEQLLEKYPDSVYGSVCRRRIRRLRGEAL